MVKYPSLSKLSRPAKTALYGGWLVGHHPIYKIDVMNAPLVISVLEFIVWLVNTTSSRIVLLITVQITTCSYLQIQKFI